MSGQNLSFGDLKQRKLQHSYESTVEAIKHSSKTLDDVAEKLRAIQELEDFQPDQQKAPIKTSPLVQKLKASHAQFQQFVRGNFLTFSLNHISGCSDNSLATDPNGASSPENGNSDSDVITSNTVTNDPTLRADNRLTLSQLQPNTSDAACSRADHQTRNGQNKHTNLLTNHPVDHKTSDVSVVKYGALFKEDTTGETGDAEFTEHALENDNATNSCNERSFDQLSTTNDISEQREDFAERSSPKAMLFRSTDDNLQSSETKDTCSDQSQTKKPGRTGADDNVMLKFDTSVNDLEAAEANENSHMTGIERTKLYDSTSEMATHDGVAIQPNLRKKEIALLEVAACGVKGVLDANLSSQSKRPLATDTGSAHRPRSTTYECGKVEKLQDHVSFKESENRISATRDKHVSDVFEDSSIILHSENHQHLPLLASVSGTSSVWDGDILASTAPTSTSITSVSSLNSAPWTSMNVNNDNKVTALHNDSSDTREHAKNAFESISAGMDDIPGPLKVNEFSLENENRLSSLSGEVTSQTECNEPRMIASVDGTNVEHFVALYAYRPKYEDELELKPGDIVSVSKLRTDGWCTGTLLQDGCGQSHREGSSGLFPGNFVVRVVPVHQQPVKTPTTGSNVCSISGQVRNSRVPRFRTNINAAQLAMPSPQKDEESMPVQNCIAPENDHTSARHKHRKPMVHCIRKKTKGNGKDVPNTILNELSPSKSSVVGRPESSSEISAAEFQKSLRMLDSVKNDLNDVQEGKKRRVSRPKSNSITAEANYHGSTQPVLRKSRSNVDISSKLQEKISELRQQLTQLTRNERAVVEHLNDFSRRSKREHTGVWTEDGCSENDAKKQLTSSYIAQQLVVFDGASPHHPDGAEESNSMHLGASLSQYKQNEKLVKSSVDASYDFEEDHRSSTNQNMALQMKNGDKGIVRKMPMSASDEHDSFVMIGADGVFDVNYTISRVCPSSIPSKLVPRSKKMDVRSKKGPGQVLPQYAANLASISILSDVFSDDTDESVESHRHESAHVGPPRFIQNNLAIV